jgi:L-threonylcarbamoyladenylate synthase
MKTKLYDIPDETCLHECAEIIKKGGTVIFPTETVYGLGANALDASAVDKIFLAKGRPGDNPLIIHLHDMEMLGKYVKEMPDVLYMLSKLYMPGPLTVVLYKKDIIPMNVTAGLDTVACRIPDNDIARKLIEYSGVPIAAPSANISGKPSPTRYMHVVNDMDGKVDAIINGGNCKIGVESTVLDLTSNIPTILRPGGVPYDRLKLAIKDLKTAYTFTGTPKSPGMKYKHYAPKAEMYLFKGRDEDVIKKINELSDASTGVLCCREDFDRYVSRNKLCVGSRKDPYEIASNIFECLRCFDEMAVDRIYSEYFDISDIGEAVMNRLTKAAAGRISEV